MGGVLDNTSDSEPRLVQAPSTSDAGAVLVRIFGWSMLAFLAVFLCNNVLIFWFGWPGAFSVTANTASARSWAQTGFYMAAILLAVVYVFRNRDRSLRRESAQISDFNTFLVRAAFWAVLIVGLVDTGLSVLRATELLDDVVGQALASKLVISKFRGTYVHMPLIAFSIVIAACTRTLGFIWLGIMIVIVELAIVMFRFVFSYEQAFMGDLVRFWYSALFLFACAHTLREDGHVRVDVLYTSFTSKTKGFVNAVGTILFGMPMCWVILVIGTSTKASVIVGALLSFETTGIGYGLMVKYLMAVFLGLFAISMLIQFVSYLFDAVADWRDEPDDLYQTEQFAK